MSLTVDYGKAVALIDDDNAHLARYTWRTDRYGYVHRKAKGKRYYLHHIVIGRAPEGSVCDHINRDKLDNRKDNLRHITQAANRQNVPAQARNKSGLRGVQIVGGRFKAYVGRKSLGFFPSAEEAAQAASTYRREHLPFSTEGAHEIFAA
jgi:hypothetical protein